MNRSIVISSVALALTGCTGFAPCKEAGDICTIAGVPEVAQNSPDGLPALEAPMYLPQDLVVGPDDLLYLVDFNNHRLRRLEEDGTVRTIAGTSFLGDGLPGFDEPTDGPALDFAFNHPTDLAFHPDDPTQLYIAAWHNSRINILDLSTGEVHFACGTGGRSFGGDGGPAEDAILDLPSSVDFDDEGNLYISDQANQIIRRIDTDGVIDTVAGRQRDEGYSGDGGPALDAQFNAAVGQAADPSSRIDVFDGVVYLADTSNHAIRTVDTVSWTVDTIAGEGTVSGSDGEGVDALDAHLNNPRDVEVASDGTVYIADTDNHCIRAIDPAGTISTVAGTCGTPGFDGDGKDATEALLFRPYGIALHEAEGALYVADTHNQVFRKVLLP